jgi:hypothetical protein
VVSHPDVVDMKIIVVSVVMMTVEVSTQPQIGKM